MQAAEHRSAVLNPSLGRTSSTFEVVEMRRKLARSTDRMQAAPTADRRMRATAQVYVTGEVTVDGESMPRNGVNRLVVGIFLTAIALMTGGVISGLS